MNNKIRLCGYVKEIKKIFFYAVTGGSENITISNKTPLYCEHRTVENSGKSRSTITSVNETFSHK